MKMHKSIKEPALKENIDLRHSDVQDNGPDDGIPVLSLLKKPYVHLFVHLFLFFTFLSSPFLLGEESLGFGQEQETANLEYWKKLVNEDDKAPLPDGMQWKMQQQVKTFNEYEGKQILSFIRNGDYTHAGEEEAIDLIFSYFPKKSDRTILDIACGLGGTAAYIQSHGWGQVTGFDIESTAIGYAKEKYPSIPFYVSDVMNAPYLLTPQTFDILCIVNAFVCFPDQLGVLKGLRKLAHNDSHLVIFDYTDLALHGENPLVGQSRQISFRPIRWDELPILLQESGWECVEKILLDEIFECWYATFLKRLEEKRAKVDERFGKGATDYAKGKYSLIYHQIQAKCLGGCLLILKPA
jgi:SAM-dependent methyltransferase